MPIKVGDRLPEGTLTEFYEQEAPGCSVGPNNFQVSDLVKGRKVVIFGLPGAFTPTCSAKHVPGYVTAHDRLLAKGVDEIWCLSVNDAMVMAAWGKDHNVGNKVRMLGDGSATLTRAMGVETDLTERGFGVRSQRYSMLVDNGVVKIFNLEKPAQFEVSSAEKMLEQL